MKYKCWLLLVMAGSSLSAATTYYVSASGNDLLNGKSASAPWRTISRLQTGSFQAGDQILFRRGDTWREFLNVPVSGLTIGAYGTGARPIITGANSITTGWTTAGTNIWSAALAVQPKQVWFGGALGVNVASQQVLTGKNEWTYTAGRLYVYSTTSAASAAIEASQRDFAVALDYVNDISFQSLHFSKGNAITVFVGSNAGGTQKFEDVVWDASPAEGLMSLNGAVQITSSIGQNNLYGLGVYGGPGLTMDNSILSGNFDTALMVADTTGPSTIQSSTITGNATLNDADYVIANWSDQSLTASNSVILPNPYLPVTWNYLGLTDDGTNVYQSPIFTSRAAPLIVIPYVDDYVNLPVAQAVASTAASYGFHITYALNTAFVTTTDWPAITDLATAGNEIAAHTRTHSDLADLNVFTIQYTGPASTAVMTIDVPSHSIKTFLNGSSTPDFNYTIPAFYPAYWLCNDISAIPGYTCSMQPYQSWWTQTWASQTYFNPMDLADVSNVDIKAPYLAKANPSRYYASELQGSKSDIEANIPGYTVKTFATPYSSSSTAIDSLIQAAGFELNRNVLNDAPQAPSSYLFSNLNTLNIAALIPEDIDTANVQRSVDGLVESLGATGGIFAFYSHGYDEFTLAQWTAFFSELKRIGATVMTASQAVDYIKAHGTLATDGSGKYWNSSIVPAANYTTTGTSPLQGAHLTQ